MIKIKTIKSIKKRIKKTSTGKIKVKYANIQHILTKKTKNYKRKHKIKNIIHKTNKKKIKKSTPYF